MYFLRDSINFGNSSFRPDSFLAPAVLLRGHSHCFGEKAGEVVGVGDSHFEADLVDLHRGDVHQMRGGLDAQGLNLSVLLTWPRSGMLSR